MPRAVPLEMVQMINVMLHIFHHNLKHGIVLMTVLYAGAFLDVSTWCNLCLAPRTYCAIHKVGLAHSRYLLNHNGGLDSDVLKRTCSLPAACRR